MAVGTRLDIAARRRITQARLNKSGCPILPCRISVYYLSGEKFVGEK